MMAADMGEEAEMPVGDEVQLLCSVTDLKYGGAAMGEEAEVPVWDEVQWLSRVTDLKYKSDGCSHG